MSNIYVEIILLMLLIILLIAAACIILVVLAPVLPHLKVPLDSVDAVFVVQARQKQDEVHQLLCCEEEDIKSTIHMQRDCCRHIAHRTKQATSLYRSHRATLPFRVRLEGAINASVCWHMPA